MNHGIYAPAPQPGDPMYYHHHLHADLKAPLAEMAAVAKRLANDAHVAANNVMRHGNEADAMVAYAKVLAAYNLVCASVDTANHAIPAMVAQLKGLEEFDRICQRSIAYGRFHHAMKEADEALGIAQRWIVGFREDSHEQVNQENDDA